MAPGERKGERGGRQFEPSSSCLCVSSFPFSKRARGGGFSYKYVSLSSTGDELPKKRMGCTLLFFLLDAC